jgi:hypothetical protein
MVFPNYRIPPSRATHSQLKPINIPNIYSLVSAKPQSSGSKVITASLFRILRQVHSGSATLPGRASNMTWRAYEGELVSTPIQSLIQLQQYRNAHRQRKKIVRVWSRLFPCGVNFLAGLWELDSRGTYAAWTTSCCVWLCPLMRCINEKPSTYSNLRTVCDKAEPCVLLL